jgi:hypothetical protein
MNKKTKNLPDKKKASAGNRKNLKKKASKFVLSEQTRVRKHPNVASRIIDGQGVIITPYSRKMQILNEVATFIWSLCDGRSVREIVEKITKEYDVSRVRALRDAKEFLMQIHRRGMVEFL